MASVEWFNCRITFKNIVNIYPVLSDENNVKKLFLCEEIILIVKITVCIDFYYLDSFRD